MVQNTYVKGRAAIVIDGIQGTRVDQHRGDFSIGVVLRGTHLGQCSRATVVHDVNVGFQTDEGFHNGLILVLRSQCQQRVPIFVPIIQLPLGQLTNSLDCGT